MLLMLLWIMLLLVVVLLLGCGCDGDHNWALGSSMRPIGCVMQTLSYKTLLFMNVSSFVENKENNYLGQPWTMRGRQSLGKKLFTLAHLYTRCWHLWDIVFLWDCAILQTWGKFISSQVYIIKQAVISNHSSLTEWGFMPVCHNHIFTNKCKKI